MDNQPEIKIIPETGQPTKNGSTSAGKIVVLTVILLLCVIITALATFSYTVKNFYVEPDENASKFQTINGILSEKAYYDMDEEKMVEAAIKAYVGATGDNYTVYYTEEEYEALMADNRGLYVGIGITVKEASVEYLDQKIAVLEITDVFPETPASEGGLLVGDYIYAVDNGAGLQSVDELGADGAREAIRGEMDAKIKLYWLTSTEGNFSKQEADFVCTQVQSRSVTYKTSTIIPTVGIIAVSKFDINTPTQLAEAFDALQAQDINRVVLDLRNNGGGDLRSVIACASYFLEPRAEIVSTEDKAGNKETQWAIRRVYTNEYAPCSVYDSDIGKYRDFKLSVLVNGKTASAAELLAAIFRDYDLATLIGTQTFGKGSMQELIDLSEYGLKGCIRVTTNLYYPPSGVGYNGQGILPDVIIEALKSSEDGELKEVEDVQMLGAISELLAVD